jgi:hypothetical protein
MDVIVVLLLGLALIALLLAAALFIPAAVSITLMQDGPLADVRVAFGLVKGAVSAIIHVTPERREYHLKVFRLTLLTRPLVKKERARERKRKKAKRPEVKDLLVNADALFAAGKELVRALTKRVSLANVNGTVRIGLADPAATGMLTGFLYAGGGIVQALLPQAHLEIAPSFEEERLDARLDVQLKLRLVRLIGPLVRFLWRTRQLFAGT